VILVTVGMQLGFNRLIKAMDLLAPELDAPVIAQIGNSSYISQNIETHEKIAPLEFEKLVSTADLIVSHAGIGSVLTAARFDKPIVLVPRRADLKEHRNDHQMATARKLEGRQGILIAYDESELAVRIAEARELGCGPSQQAPAAQQFHEALARFIEKGIV
jgi:UDP-N-acetylglucosamine transferase subunit ALG13